MSGRKCPDGTHASHGIYFTTSKCTTLSACLRTAKRVASAQSAFMSAPQYPDVRSARSSCRASERASGAKKNQQRKNGTSQQSKQYDKNLQTTLETHRATFILSYYRDTVGDKKKKKKITHILHNYTYMRQKYCMLQILLLQQQSRWVQEDVRAFATPAIPYPKRSMQKFKKKKKKTRAIQYEY